MAARTHYQVLGVRETASADEVRRAHRQLAQLLHPDRLAAASSAERSLGERRIREVNEAWTVLSDPTRRAAYDRGLRASRTGPTPPPRAGGQPGGAAGHGPVGDRPDDDRFDDDRFDDEVDFDEDELTAGHIWLFRRGPVLAALLVAVVLFVVTAYAGTGGEGATGANGPDAGPATTRPPALEEGGACVRFLPDSGRAAYTVSCGGPNDGRVVGEVPNALDCRTDGGYAIVGGRFKCLTRE